MAVFLDLLGFGMIIADIQLRAQALMPPQWPTGVVVGLLLASTFVTQTVVSPKWGALSDRSGRKRVIVACTVLSGLAMVVYGVASSLPVLFMSRFLSGLGAANVAVAQALISDTHEGDDRTAALGRIGAAISAGLVVGPPVGGIISHWGGSQLIGYLAGAASLLGAGWLAMALPNLPPREERHPGRRPVIDLSLLTDIPRLRPLVLIATVAWFSLATLEGTFARLINHLFGYGQLEFGFVFGYESLLGIIVSGYLLGHVVKRVREARLLRSAYVLQGVGLALNPLSALFASAVPPLGILFLASTLYAFGSSVANPTVNSLCSKLAPDERQGELFGLLQGTRSVGFVVGPVLGGALFDVHPAAPYYLAGAVCVVAAFLVPALD